MFEDKPNNSEASPATVVRRRRTNPLLIAGSILWILCLAGIVYGWYEWRSMQLNAIAESKPDKTTEENDQRPKGIKLRPRKDGGFDVKDAANAEQDDPWDADGIEEFSFTDSSGHKVTKKDLLGKPFIIAFVFTLCRGPCPDVTLQMRETQDRLKDYDFNLVTLTVDPARDTTEVLQEYGEKQGANFDRWKFLTGDQADIYGLIQRSFKMPVKELEGAERQPGFEIIHSTNIMLVDRKGRVVGKYNAKKDDEMAKLRRAIRRIATNKNKGKRNEEGQP